MLPSWIIWSITPAARRASLPHHALADIPRLQAIIEPEAADMGVGADALDAGEVLDLRDLENDVFLGEYLILEQFPSFTG